mmetsp:Transcript_23454/g.48816  ORF Transcript_23454/g.48816 Transcript_23454/m.48816 type:complete len:119 (+) Transcript_23454:126-482(+)
MQHCDILQDMMHYLPYYRCHASAPHHRRRGVHSARRKYLTAAALRRPDGAPRAQWRPKVTSSRFALLLLALFRKQSPSACLALLKSSHGRISLLSSWFGVGVGKNYLPLHGLEYTQGL